MKMLATTYGALGRVEESLALKEKTLEFELRVLPGRHPHIGAATSCFSRGLLVFKLSFCSAGSAMANLANAYIMAGRHADAFSLHQKALDFRQSALPAGHPDIGAPPPIPPSLRTIDVPQGGACIVLH